MRLTHSHSHNLHTFDQVLVTVVLETLDVFETYSRLNIDFSARKKQLNGVRWQLKAHTVAHLL